MNKIGEEAAMYMAFDAAIDGTKEAENNGAFENTLVTVNIQNLLNAMGHPQTPTIMKTDNSTTAGFVNKNVMLK